VLALVSKQENYLILNTTGTFNENKVPLKDKKDIIREEMILLLQFIISMNSFQKILKMTTPTLKHLSFYYRQKKKSASI